MNTKFKLIDNKWIGGKYCRECCADCSSCCESDCPADIEGSCDRCEFKKGYKREDKELI